MFSGFGPEVFEWFTGLERDNSRDYFTATRDRYEDDVRGGFEALLDELSVEFGGHVKVFRQQRDLRFTPDKTPYKTRTYGVIRDTPAARTGLYAQISATGLYAGTGYYQLARDQLERYRDAVADDRTGPAARTAVAAVEGAGLERRRPEPAHRPARPPARPSPHRAAAAQGADRRPRPRGRGRDRARRRARARRAETWRAAAPMTAWLDEHVGPSTLPADPRRGRR